MTQPTPPQGWHTHRADPAEWAPAPRPKSLGLKIAKILGIAVAVIAVIILLAVACKPNATPPPAGSVPASIDPTIPPGDQSNNGATDSEQTAAFGKTVTLSNGTSVAVSQPTPFKPSQTAVGSGAARALAFDVAVTNGTDTPFDTALASATMTYNGIAATQVFDSAKNINGFPSTQLQPGKTVKARIVFAIPNDEKAPLQLDVHPQPFTGDVAVFTGQG